MLLFMALASAEPGDGLLEVQLAELARAGEYIGRFEAPPAAAAEEFTWPVSGRISSHFGFRNISVGGNRNHGGIDIAANTGTPVAASRSGTVTFSGWNGAYGYVIYVDHGDGSETRYAHLSALHAGAGQVVAQGDTIGLTGSTGASTGPHLHFEIRQQGVALDPLVLIGN
ncbi:MAG TPA: M23 family metallopeptidase [Deinococcales bacterium]|nr:M23 family metallopeptidase [Deinococcales bacterium]